MDAGIKFTREIIETHLFVDDVFVFDFWSPIIL